jgi:hypothetical protein
MIHLCLDANVYLDLHGLAGDQVVELEKLPALTAAGEVILWLPDSVQDEYRRNRPKVVSDALKALRDSRLKVSPPALSQGLPERRALEDAARDVQRAHSTLMRTLEAQAASNSLPADLVIDKLFAAATTIGTAPFLGAARQRRELRQPPGKADSVGDALTWEALLQTLPQGAELHFVSSDQDFQSPLTPDAFHEYLADQWTRVHGAPAILYSDLDRFLSQHFTAIKVPSDIPKVRLIQDLETSGSFVGTHSIVAQLAKYDVFSAEQARLIALHSVRNSQVRWIAADADVKEFLTRILDSHRASIPPELTGILERSMSGDLPAYSSVRLGDTLV